MVFNITFIKHNRDIIPKPEYKTKQKYNTLKQQWINAKDASYRFLYDT